MEREIKFRAWHKEEDKMYLNLQTGFNSHAIGGQYLEECFTDSDLEIMQYTGLKDKNGKEIYEGDILEVDIIMGEDEHRGVHSTEKGVVVFKSGCFNLDITSVEYYGSSARIDNEGYGEDTLINIMFENESEVIGNIYENPELLELGKEEKNRKGEELKNDRGDDSSKYEGDSNGEEL